MGRRQSIGRTTARRRPYARKRPEAEYIPSSASGRTRALLYVCDSGTERTAVTRLRRRPRAVYRVYGEEEYLAGADALPAQEDLPLAEEATHGRRLQRIAGAAALTGAVGTVGGVVGLAGLRAHAVDRREIAQRVASPLRAVARGHASSSAHMMRRPTLHPMRPRRVHARRGTAMRLSHGSALRADSAARTIAASASRSTPAHRSEIDGISDRPASAAPGTSTDAASAVQGPPPAIPDARPRAQSEFGFER